MKTTVVTAILCVTTFVPLFADGTNILSDDKSRVSYAIGMMLGHGWKQRGIDVDYNWVLRGLQDAQSGGPSLMAEKEIQDTLAKFQQDLAAKQEKMHREIAEKNKQAGETFLAQNKAAKGVVTLPDGLQYTIIAEGAGASPGTSDTVAVKYRGTLVDGTEFDRSDKAEFQVGRVIHGWTEALTHMRVGSQWRLFIPPELAYGQSGRPPRIEPNSVLIFDVELLAIKQPEPQAPLTSDIIKVPSTEEMKNGAKIEVIKPQDLEKAQQQSQSGK
jgi:FKBP-type peptidyl-prolyl cis-trans isomerase